MEQKELIEEEKDKLKLILELLDYWAKLIQQYLSDYTNNASSEDKLSSDVKHLVSLRDFILQILKKIILDNHEILNNESFYTKVIDLIQTAIDHCVKQIKRTEFSQEGLGYVLNGVKYYIDEIHDRILNIITSQEMTKEFIRLNLDPQLEEVKNTVKDIKAAKEVLDAKRTEEIFSSASKKFLIAARIYEGLFYFLLITSLYLTLNNIVENPYQEATKVNFIVLKLLTITFVVTLGTLFLRKAAHLRKLHEQANQTSLELQALPMFLKNVEKSQHSEIYKNLAEKYFGKELDQTQNNKVGDLLQDQLKSSIELVKASAEMVKSKNSTKPTDQE